MALKVLLADDSMTAQNMGKKILSDAGFEVLTVSNGAAAIKKVAEFKPNIIILDIYMPGYTGLEVCERVRATDSTTPILLTVGKLEPFRQEDVEHVHADAIIIKPFEATDLINTVQRYADQADVAASKAAVPPPAPVVELPPPPPPAQLSEEDLAFLRGEEPAAAMPELPASNAGHAAAMNPDFAELLAAPQAQVSPAEDDIPLNDFELPPLTEADFAMLQDGANAESAPAYQETEPSPAPAIDLLAAPAVVETQAAQPQAPSAELPVFQLDENLTAPEGDIPAMSAYEPEPVFAPVEATPAIASVAAEEAAPIAEAAMAAVPVFEPTPEAHAVAAPVFLPEPEFTGAESAYIPEGEPAAAPEPQQAAEEFALELTAEEAAPVSAEPLMEPILETAPTAETAEAAPVPELEPLELEQSGPQPTSEIVAPPEELAPAYEFIGASGTTPVDLDVEPLPVEPVAEPEPAVFVEPELLETAAAGLPLAAAAAVGSVSHYEAAPALLDDERQSAVASTETPAPVELNLNYATVAGVVHRVFDRYKSQMIADIVRELSEKQK